MVRLVALLPLLLVTADAFALDLTVGAPRRAGVVALTADGCTPGVTVTFMAGPSAGHTCPGKLGGCIDLAKPKIVSQVACNAGTATAGAPISPKFAPGTRLVFQAMETTPNGLDKSPTETRWVDMWAAAATVDGSLGEWVTADTQFATTSAANANYVTWDEEYLYIAALHPDVAFGGPQHWYTIYLDTTGQGAAAGTTLGTQTPLLPGPMDYEIRWKADDSYDDRLVWDGAGWVGTGYWLGTEGSAHAESNVNQAVEFAIPWSAIGDPELVTLHLAWVYEGAGFESTYSGSPSTSFADGYDPDYTAAIVVDRTSSLSPVLQN